MRSRFWVALDCAMLLAVLILQPWRLTGVVLHEWLAAALLAGILTHLVLHWPWIESRSRRLRIPRTRVNYVLNVLVFVAMAAALISGFAISKVVLPLHHDPAAYMRWRSIHGFTSRTALIGIGLHLAMNWDRMFAARRAMQAIRVRVLWVLPAVALVGAMLWIIAARMPAPQLTLIRPDGKRQIVTTPPPDIVALRPAEAAPSARGVPALLAHTILLTVSCVVGRKVLRLRL